MTTIKTRNETIREFLALPKEALPQASFASRIDEEDIGGAWDYLRDAILPEDEQDMNHWGVDLVLRADRDEWRNGVTVNI